MATGSSLTQNHSRSQRAVIQQDGATCHTARATIDLLKDTFDDRLISRFGSVNWPPRSCDLTPLDYFLWGYVKSLVYADKPQTLDHLEDNIRCVIADTRPQMLEKVIENWTSRLDYIRASRGSPMPEIIFKIRLSASAANSPFPSMRVTLPQEWLLRHSRASSHTTTEAFRPIGHTYTFTLPARPSITNQLNLNNFLPLLIFERFGLALY
ncbi:transposable element Tc3 transposase [Trichonephila clavipes]|nr:transposable element Tc3 transposase [Trichonephila clavipes]